MIGILPEERPPAHVLNGQPFNPGHPFDSSNFGFTPDSRHIVYGARLSDRWCVALDGQRVSEDFDGVGDIRFSADGRRLAFAARHGKQWCVVADGRPGRAFDSIKQGSLRLSPTGDVLVFEAERDRHSYLVKNGTEADVTGLSGRTSSLDGRRDAFVQKQAHGSSVWIDGQAGPCYDKVGKGSIVFSPDGRRCAYTARQDGKWFVVLDGAKGPRFDRMDHGSLTFSPDGRRFAYVAGVGRWWHLWGAGWKAVIDGVEGPRFSSVGKAVFSLDGTRVAYPARARGQSFMVIDGTREGKWPAVSDFTFSPDGRRYAYVAGPEDGGPQRVVVEGKEGRKYEAVEAPDFTPAGDHVAYVAHGYKYRDRKGLFTAQRRGGFLVMDEYESEAWVASPPPSQYNRRLHRVVRLGFEPPRTVFVISMDVDSHGVSFDRVEITWGG
jgi:Tol biopolymer transport system component